MKKRILLVEDNSDTVVIISHALNFLGYETTVANNGIEAVDLAASENPDLIIMDMMLPKMNGFEATAKIRNHPKTECVPIVAMTAMAMPGDRDKCLKAGCDDYLAKPFTYQELGHAIEKLLGKEVSQRPPQEQPVGEIP